MRLYSFQLCSRLWYSHKPPPVIESSTAKIYGISDWLQLLTIPVIILTLYFMIFPSKNYSLLRFLVQQTLKLLLKRMKRLINIPPWQQISIRCKYASYHYPSCSGMYGCGLLLLLTVFKEHPRVYTEIVRPLTESCADWDFTSIKNNTHSPMIYFLCKLYKS